MPSTLNPFGFIPQPNFVGGTPTRMIEARAGGISAAYSSNIFNNQPVLDSGGGVLNPVTSAADFLGVFLGVQYVATAGGTPQWLNWWTASTAFVAGSLIAYYTRDPNLRFIVQADGAVAQTAIGDQADTSNFTDGSTGTGNSQCTLSSSLKTAGQQGMWRIEGLYPRPDNDWGDAYPILIVSIARSQFVANKVAI